MKKTILLAVRILLFGFILPFRIWQLSREKLVHKSKSNSITNLLDYDYVATSWLDLMIDAIIFIMYPLGLLIIIIITFFTDISYMALLGLIPLYFINLIISFSRELGGSFMLLHMNVKKIRNYLENQNTSQ